MADSKIEELERAWRSSGDAVDATAYAIALGYSAIQVPCDDIVEMLVSPIPRTSDVWLRPIEPTRVWEQVALLGASQWVWQYVCRNVMFFEHRGLRYLYLPPELPRVAGETASLTSVVGYLWPQKYQIGLEQYRVWLRFVRGQYGAQTPKTSPGARGIENVIRADFSAVFDRELRRQFQAHPANIDVHAHAIGLLDLLITFRSTGSEELRLPYVMFDAQTLQSLQPRMRRSARCPEQLDRVIAREQAITRPQTEEPARITAYTYKATALDSCIGGHYRELARIVLTFLRDSWRLDRTVLWIDEEEGIEKT